MCYVSLHCFHVIFRQYMARMGNRDQNERYRSGDGEVNYNRVGVGLLSQDQKYRVWFERGGYVNHSRKKGGRYESRENICMCLFLEIRDKLFRKEKRSWLGVAKWLRWTVCNWGRGFSVWLICGSKTLGDYSETTLRMSF